MVEVDTFIEIQTASLICKCGALEESQTAALIVSGRLFERESDSGSDCKWSAHQ